MQSGYEHGSEEGLPFLLPTEDMPVPFQRGAQLLLRPKPAHPPAQRPSVEVMLQASRSSLTAEQWEACEQRSSNCKTEMAEALNLISKFQSAEGQWHCTQTEFVNEIRRILLPHWRCGNTYHHREAWQLALRPMLGSSDVAEALQTVTHGVRLKLVLDAYSQEQQRRPDFRKKEAAVTSMLGGSSPEVSSLLHSKGLPSVWLGNMQSAVCAENCDFIQGQVDKAISNGTAVDWRSDLWGEPDQMVPLGCATQQRTSKQRMTIAPLLLNFFEEYHSFKQERRRVSGPEHGHETSQH